MFQIIINTTSGSHLIIKHTSTSTNLSVNPLLALGCVFYTSIEINWDHVLWSCLLPWVAKPQPVIRLLNLLGMKNH